MISLVAVSHSPDIAKGISALTGEIAKGCSIYAIGGTIDRSLGADFDAILATLETAVKAGEVIVLTDLGSARMTAKMAIEALNDEQQGRVYLSDAALVEGAIAAAATIAAGFSVSEVLEQLEPLNLPK